MERYADPPPVAMPRAAGAAWAISVCVGLLALTILAAILF